MNIQNFNDYLAHCQRIQRAFKHLPIFNGDAVLNAWDAGGIFGFDFTGTCDRYSCSWVNVGAHMSVAAVFGYQLAFRVQKVLYEEKNTITDIVEALLIHDWNKRGESACIKESKSVDRVQMFLANDGRRLLQWFPEKIITLSLAGGTGGVFITNERPLTLGEKIVFYADHCTSDSCIVPFRERLADLLSEFREGGRYVHADNYYQKKYGMSHNEKHTALLEMIENELAQLCGYAAPFADLPFLITEKEFHGSS